MDGWVVCIYVSKRSDTSTGEGKGVIGWESYGLIYPVKDNTFRNPICNKGFYVATSRREARGNIGVRRLRR